MGFNLGFKGLMNKLNNKFRYHVASCWLFILSHTTMHGSMNIKPGTHCTGDWVDPRAGLDGCGKSHLPPGSDSRTVQPLASRYTDWAIPVHGKLSALGGKSDPVPLCPEQISLVVAWDRIRASAVRDRRMTAWAMGPRAIVVHRK